MATTALTVREPSLTGTIHTLVTPTGTGLSNGVTFANDGRTTLTIINAGAGACVPTFDATRTVGGVAFTDPTGSVTNDSIPEEYGPFPINVFGNTVTAGFSLATGVSVYATRLPG